MKKNQSVKVRAGYYRAFSAGVAVCELCPRNCFIERGKTGACGVRTNVDGTLIAETYGRTAALQVDPIEKKPLAWYQSGTKTFSIGTYGCNFTCKFCQNDQLSRAGAARERKLKYIAPADLVDLALNAGCSSVAFTYNEPTVFFEYMVDIAKLARKAGLGTVLVSNGYISAEPRANLYPLIDAANIDIKAFSDDFYSSICGGKLQPVLESCRYFKQVVGGHLEITNLIIPNRNDSPEMIQALLDWIGTELGKDTPIHFNAYFPTGGFNEPPTPTATIYRAEMMAKQSGFTRVKIGNLTSKR